MPVLSILSRDFRLMELDMYGDEHKKPPFLSLNPISQMPAIKGDGCVVEDSHGCRVGAKGLQLKPGVLKMYASPGNTLIGDIQISLTEQVTKQFVPIKDGTERLINVLDSTLKSITLLTEKASALIDANHESITSASGNIDTLSQTLNAQRKHFEDIVYNIKSFSKVLAESDLDQTILQVDETMNSIDLVLKDVNSGRGSLGKLIKDGDFYSEMSESMTQLELLLKDMRENPKRYVHFSLFGRKGSESSKDSIK